VGTWIARLQGFDPFRVPLDAAALLALAAGWVVHVRRVRACSTASECALPQRLMRTRVGLTIATIVIVGLVAAPYLIARFGG